MYSHIHKLGTFDTYQDNPSNHADSRTSHVRYPQSDYYSQLRPVDRLDENSSVEPVLTVPKMLRTPRVELETSFLLEFVLERQERVFMTDRNMFVRFTFIYSVGPLKDESHHIFNVKSSQLLVARDWRLTCLPCSQLYLILI